MTSSIFEKPDVLLVSCQRSGTHFLQASLASHPLIHGRGECVMTYTHTLAATGGAVDDERYRFRNRPGQVNIAIVMYSQVAAFERLCGSLFVYPIIHLKRNAGDVARSAAQMRVDRAVLGSQARAHYRTTEVPHDHAVVPAELVTELEREVVAKQHLYEKVLRDHPQIIKVTYEEMTHGQQVNEFPEGIARRLLSFLNVSYVALRNELRKTGPRSG
jgi:hypothetical protein